MEGPLQNSEIILENKENPRSPQNDNSEAKPKSLFKPHLTIDSNPNKNSITDSKQLNNGLSPPNMMKGSILKNPNSPRKIPDGSIKKSIQIKSDPPQVFIVPHREQTSKTCTCICRIF